MEDHGLCHSLCMRWDRNPSRGLKRQSQCQKCQHFGSSRVSSQGNPIFSFLTMGKKATSYPEWWWHPATTHLGKQQHQLPAAPVGEAQQNKQQQPKKGEQKMCHIEMLQLRGSQFTGEIPETNGYHVKVDYSKRNVVFQPSILRCCVSFREGLHFFTLSPISPHLFSWLFHSNRSMHQLLHILVTSNLVRKYKWVISWRVGPPTMAFPPFCLFWTTNLPFIFAKVETDGIWPFLFFRPAIFLLRWTINHPKINSRHVVIHPVYFCEHVFYPG